MQIFIVGNARSGTTMMGQVLGRHHRVLSLPELRFFGRLWEATDAGKDVDREAATTLAARLLHTEVEGAIQSRELSEFMQAGAQILKGAEVRTAIDVYRTFLDSRARAAGKQFACDQTPAYALYLPEILQQLPEARVINMIRDPRDVLLSQKRRWRRRRGVIYPRSLPARHRFRTWANYHPITTSQLWRAAVSAPLKAAPHPRLLSVRYEDLLRAPSVEMTRICRFLDLDFEPSMLLVPRAGSSTVADLPDVLGLDASRAEAWRQGGLSATELFICQTINGPLLQRYGYTTERVRPNPIKLAIHCATLGPKLTLALSFQLPELRDLRAAIRRRLP